MWLPRPAPSCTSTSCPCDMRAVTPAGVIATRFSSALISVGMPTRTNTPSIARFSWQNLREQLAGRVVDVERGVGWQDLVVLHLPDHAHHDGGEAQPGKDLVVIDRRARVEVGELFPLSDRLLAAREAFETRHADSLAVVAVEIHVPREVFGRVAERCHLPVEHR